MGGGPAVMRDREERTNFDRNQSMKGERACCSQDSVSSLCENGIPGPMAERDAMRWEVLQCVVTHPGWDDCFSSNDPDWGVITLA